MTPAICHIPAPGPRPHMSLTAGARSTRPRRITASRTTPSDITCDISRVVSLRRVTRVTQLSSHSLRACARRANRETCVTNVISRLTSDTSDIKLQLSATPAHAPMRRPNKTCVTNVTTAKP